MLSATVLQGLLSVFTNMASTMTEDRLKKISEIKQYVKSLNDKMRFLTKELNWSYESFAEENTVATVTCSVHPEHIVRLDRKEKHEDKCRWLSEGYHAEDVPFPDNPGTGSYVVFTPELQQTVLQNAGCCSSISSNNSTCGGTRVRGIPQTSARFDQDFSRVEKLALYDYVIANTHSQKIFMDFSSLAVKEDKTEKKVMTPLEIAAAERDAKRRRASYRNKVHTNRKTQTEILREVIESQMDTLREETNQQNEDSERVMADIHFTGADHSKVRKSSQEDSNRSRHDSYHKIPHKNDKTYRSDRKSKHRSERDHRDGKHKKSKKRERSRSGSYERSKHKKSFNSHHKNYTKY